MGGSARRERGPWNRRVLRGLEIVACLVLSTFIALGASASYGYWTSLPGGSGVAAASTGTMQPVLISALTGGDDPDVTLVPGATADVILRVTNPNPVAVRVWSVEANGSVFADSTFPACTTTGVTFTAPAVPLDPPVIVEAVSTLLVHLPGAAAMDNSSSSACQGALFHVPVTLTARQ